MKQGLYSTLRRLCPQLQGCCRLCGVPCGNEALCGDCRAELPRNRNACPRCAQPLPVPGICPDCLRAPPVFQACLAPLLYRAPVDTLVSDLKFRGRLLLAPLLAELLLDAVQAQNTPLPQALVPVPLHPRRLARRGFNQALELCRPLGRTLRIPILSGCCRRRPGPPQASLPAAQRKGNVRLAFEIQSSLPCDDLVIVDDVLTTGSTVSALTAALRRHGAQRVRVWVVARAGSRPRGLV